MHPDSGVEGFEIGQPTAQGVYTLAVHPVLDQVVAGGAMSRLIHVDLEKAPAEPVTKDWPDPMQQSESVISLTYSQDGTWVAAGGSSGSVVLVDAQTGETSHRLSPLKNFVRGLRFTRDHLWAGSRSGELARYSLDNIEQTPLILDQGAPVYDLAMTTATTERPAYLIAGLGDGRAVARSLPDGDLVATLLPMRDGSWATVFPDGRHITGSAADPRSPARSGEQALDLAFITPGERKVVTLNNLSNLSFGATRATRQPDGTVRLRSTVFSPAGPPKVTLDGLWPVASLLPSPTVVQAYEIDVTLDDPSTRMHELRARAPDGISQTTSFQAPPTDINGRALIIGNSAYPGEGRALPGAAADVTTVRDGFSNPRSWALRKDRTTIRRDRTADELAADVKAFFESAQPDDTLLFYFAGHGMTHDGQGLLLGVDHKDDKDPRGLPADVLWRAIDDALKRTGERDPSKAVRVLVVLDACRAGGLDLPESLLKQAQKADTLPQDASESPRKGIRTQLRERVGLIMSASPGRVAQETEAGGEFTRKWIGAMQNPDATAYDQDMVTVATAYSHALDFTYRQEPRMAGGLGPLMLSRLPRKRDDSQVERAKGTTRPRNSSIRTAYTEWQKQKSRQITGDAETPSDVRIQVDLEFGHDTEAVRLSLRLIAEPGESAETHEVFKVPGKPGKKFWPADSSTRVFLTLEKNTRLPGGEYQVMATPCRRVAGKKKTDQPFSCVHEFSVPLKPTCSIRVRDKGRRTIQCADQ